MKCWQMNAANHCLICIVKRLKKIDGSIVIVYVSLDILMFHLLAVLAIILGKIKYALYL